MFTTDSAYLGQHPIRYVIVRGFPDTGSLTLIAPQMDEPIIGSYADAIARCPEPLSDEEMLIFELKAVKKPEGQR